MSRAAPPAASAAASPERTGEIIRTTGERVESGFWATLNEILLNIPQFLAFLLALVLAWLVGRLIGRALFRRLYRQGKDDLGRLMAAVATGMSVLLGGLFALALLFPSVDPAAILSLLGFGSIAIGFAFRDILQNLVAGVILLIREPYKKGDEIVVGDGEYEGTVEEVETRATHIRTIDRRLVVVPNVKLFTNAITVNTDCDFRMTTAKVSVAYGGDPRHAIEVVRTAIRTAEGVHDRPEPIVAIDALNEFSIDLVFAFAARAGAVDQIKTKGAVLLAIHDACRAHGIELPFPTQVNLLRSYGEDGAAPNKLEEPSR